MSDVEPSAQTMIGMQSGERWAVLEDYSVVTSLVEQGGYIPLRAYQDEETPANYIYLRADRVETVYQITDEIRARDARTKQDRERQMRAAMAAQGGPLAMPQGLG